MTTVLSAVDRKGTYWMSAITIRLLRTALMPQVISARFPSSLQSILHVPDERLSHAEIQNYFLRHREDQKIVFIIILFSIFIIIAIVGACE